MKVFGKRAVVPRQSAEQTNYAETEPAPVANIRPAVIKTEVRERVLKQIDPSAAANLSRGELQYQVEELIHEIANNDHMELSGREQARLAEELANDMTGYGPLQALLQDEQVSDIMVNSPTMVYVEKKGLLERSGVRFRDAEHIMSIAQKIAARVGRRIDESSPMVDARLPDGSRVNVVFPPLAIDSPCISIRKFPSRRIDLEGMAENGTLTRGVARLLEVAARCRLNILISGGTGSGKTTLLNALSRHISHKERLITIEDAAELQLQQPHVIRLETRPPSLEGTGQVTQRDLVRNALRMRPDRIIVGEVRGDEAVDMLQAMNTGHDGSLSTVHANSARDALMRLENMVQMAHVNLPVRALRVQIVSALDLIVQVERMYDGVRRLTQLTEVCGLEGEVITTNDIVKFEFKEEDKQGRIVGSYVAPHPHPVFMDRLAYFGMERVWAEAIQEVQQ
jgi:pilus assembly protein CpaF